MNYGGLAISLEAMEDFFISAPGHIKMNPNMSHKTLPSNSSNRQPIFAQYAAAYWWQHAQKSNQACSPTLLSFAIRLLTDEIDLLTWVRRRSFVATS